MSYESLLQDTITHWSSATIDGFGDLTFPAPAQILGRWQDDTTLFQDLAGEEFISSSIVYTKTELQENDWLYLGTSAEANPQNQSGAFRVRRRYNTSTPNDSISVYKNICG